jgi:hypothetical protein
LVLKKCVRKMDVEGRRSRAVETNEAGETGQERRGGRGEEGKGDGGGPRYIYLPSSK